jgi:hypothetical protein
MPATVTPLTPRRASGPAPRPQPAPRRPFRDNQRHNQGGIALLHIVLIALLAIANG